MHATHFLYALFTSALGKGTVKGTDLFVALTNAILYGTNLPQGAVRPGRDTFIIDV